MGERKEFICKEFDSRECGRKENDCKDHCRKENDCKDHCRKENDCKDHDRKDKECKEAFCRIEKGLELIIEGLKELKKNDCCKSDRDRY